MIKGVALLGKPLYTVNPYSVYVGYIEGDTNKDIPHYLIVHTEHGVVEGSSARYWEARAFCQGFSKEIEAQDDALAKNESLVEEVEADPSIEPAQKDDQRVWKKH